MQDPDDLYERAPFGQSNESNSSHHGLRTSPLDFATNNLSGPASRGDCPPIHAFGATNLPDSHLQPG
jgi:hypothetical protein